MFIHKFKTIRTARLPENLKIAGVFAFFLYLTASCTAPGDSLTAYVDTKIGTGGHGHVFVGANVPFGMVQLAPTSIT